MIGRQIERLRRASRIDALVVAIVENDAVCRLHESFGFQREGLYRQHVRKGGKAVDVVGLGLIASDWIEQRPVSMNRLESKGFDLSAWRGAEV